MSGYTNAAHGTRNSPVSLFPRVQYSPSPDHQAQRDSGVRQGQAPSTVAASLSHRAQADCDQTQTWSPTERKRSILGEESFPPSRWFIPDCKRAVPFKRAPSVAVAVTASCSQYPFISSKKIKPQVLSWVRDYPE